MGRIGPKIQQSELLRLPFPTPNDVQEGSRSEAAAAALTSLVDEARKSAKKSFTLRSGNDSLLSDLDSHCYGYFGLGEEEIALVEDAVEKVIPCAQPHLGSSVDLWKPAGRSDRQAYASTIVRTMTQWLDRDAGISVVLEARNEDLALLHLRLVERRWEEPYRERDDRLVGEALRQLGARAGMRLPGNFQVVPDFRLFIGNSLYLIKPLQRRFWLKSAAIADADAMAMDLHDAAGFGNST